MSGDRVWPWILKASCSAAEVGLEMLDAIGARGPRRGRSSSVGLSIALLVLVTALRFAVSNPIEAVGFLYVIPISMMAVEGGWRAGLEAALVAILLTIFWALARHVPLGIVGYGTRIATFASVGMMVGLQSERRRRLEDLERKRERLIEELHASAMHDPLTGLPNRRAWDARFSHELRSAARSGRPLTVAGVDLDNLKAVNDSRGHQQGDALIQRCARAWAGAIRETDFIARVGGDEFLVLLPECSADEAQQLGHRVLGPVPVSVGIAAWNGREAADALVRRADQALYAAKSASDTQIAVARDPGRDRTAPAIAAGGVPSRG